jgi:hypothetical protein
LKKAYQNYPEFDYSRKVWRFEGVECAEPQLLIPATQTVRLPVRLDSSEQPRQGKKIDAHPSIYPSIQTREDEKIIMRRQILAMHSQAQQVAVLSEMVPAVWLELCMMTQDNGSNIRDGGTNPRPTCSELH